MPFLSRNSGSFFSGERPPPPIINPPNTLSGVCNPNALRAYFGPAPKTGFRITTTGNDTATAVPITYVERGTSGLNSLTTKDCLNNGIVTYPGDVKYFGNVDDGWYEVPLPWNINYLGTVYNKVFIGTNSYATFGFGSSLYSGLNYASPNLPKILITAADNSLQQIWYGATGSAPNRVFYCRFEGVNALHYTVGSIYDGDHYPGGPYTPAQGPMVWEMLFYEDPNTQIDLHIIENSRWFQQAV